MREVSMENHLGNKTNFGLLEIRGIACVMVLISHLSMSFPQYISLGYFGHLGVQLFLVMSGYLAYGYCGKESYDINETLAYICKKYKGLFPLYFLAMIAMIIPKLCMGEALTKNLMLSFLLHIGMLQSWAPQLRETYPFNNPDWYLSVIFFCWLIRPLLIRVVDLLKKRSVFAIIGLLFIEVLIFLMGKNCEYLSLITYSFPAIRGIDFLIGMFCASLGENSNCNEKKRSKFALTAICLLIGLAWYLYILQITLSEWICVQILGVIVICFFSKSSIFEGSTPKGLIWISKHSTTLYLLHYVIYSYVWVIVHALGLSIALHVVADIVLAIACTMIWDYTWPKINLRYRCLLKKEK